MPRQSFRGSTTANKLHECDRGLRLRFCVQKAEITGQVNICHLSGELPKFPLIMLVYKYEFLYNVYYARTAVSTLAVAVAAAHSDTGCFTIAHARYPGPLANITKCFLNHTP